MEYPPNLIYLDHFWKDFANPPNSEVIHIHFTLLVHVKFEKKKNSISDFF